MPTMRKSVFFLFITAVCLWFVSCTKIMGYGVVLWNLPEYNIQDGDIVPVYIKSNISHVYVIGAGDTKIEVPLWQITEPISKRKAEREAEKYADFRHTYAKVALDGLPVRAEPINTAKQVYRLRKNETVRILYKGNGQTVMSGKTALEGDWLRVLTFDGNQGWCFSYNLRQFKTGSDGLALDKDVREPEDTSADLSDLLSKKWYPESYRQMIDSDRIDPAKLIPSYNLSFDEETQKLSFTMPGLKGEWNYTGAENAGSGEYKLNSIPIVIAVRGDDYIIVKYTGSSGKPENFGLVSIEEDIGELVMNEIARRSRIFEQIYMAGPVFKSASYGTLTFNQDQSFTWTNYKLLVPSVIAQSAKNRGTVSIKYFTGRALSAAYDGVLTFNFDGMSKEVNFLYRLDSGGLRMEDAAGVNVTNGIINERALSPLVLFFNADR